MTDETSSFATADPLPGWYEDPTTPGMLRLWNGREWDAQRQPAISAPSATPPVPPWRPSQGSHPAKRSVATGWVVAIALTFGALLSLGIAAGAGALNPPTARTDIGQTTALVDGTTPIPEPVPALEPAPETTASTAAPTTAPPTTAPGPQRHPTVGAAIAQWASDNLGVAVLGTCETATPGVGAWCWSSSSRDFAIGPAFSEFAYTLTVAGDPARGWYVSGSSPIQFGP